MKNFAHRGFVKIILALIVSGSVLIGMKDFDEKAYEKELEELEKNAQWTEEQEKKFDEEIEKLQKENIKEGRELIQKKRKKTLEEQKQNLKQKQKNQAIYIQKIENVQSNIHEKAYHSYPIYGDLYPKRKFIFTNECGQIVYCRWYFIQNGCFVSHREVNEISEESKNFSFERPVLEDNSFSLEPNKSKEICAPLPYSTDQKGYEKFVPYPIFSLNKEVLKQKIDLKTIKKTTTRYKLGYSYYYSMLNNYNGKIGDSVIHVRDFSWKNGFLQKGKYNFSLIFAVPNNPETLTLINK